MTYFISLTLIILEFMGLFFVLQVFFDKKKKPQFYIPLLLFLFAAFQIFFTLISQNAPLIVHYTTGILLFFLLTNFCFVGSRAYKLFISLIYFAVLSVIDYSFMSFSFLAFSFTYKALLHNELIYCLFAVSSKLVLLLIAFTFKMLMQNTRNKKAASAPYTWLLLIVPVFSVLNIIFVIDESIKAGKITSWTFAYSAVLLLCNTLMIYLWDKMDSEYKLKTKSALLEQEIINTMDKTLALEQLYSTQRRLTHDFKNHLNVLQGLIELSSYDKAKQYIQSLAQLETAQAQIIYTNHSLIDVVLNQKYALAARQGILISFLIDDLSISSINDADIIALISNALDNAIEAAQLCEGDKSLRVKISASSSGNFLLSVINSSLPVDIGNGSIKTTKANNMQHGYGLQIIRQIVEKYNGELLLKYRDNYFQLTAVLNANCEAVM